MKGSESAGRYQEGEPESHGAYVNQAALREVKLSWAILNRASLRWASLVSLWTNSTRLSQASSLAGSVLPDGEEQAETPSIISVTDQQEKH